MKSMLMKYSCYIVYKTLNWPDVKLQFINIEALNNLI